MLLHVRVPYQNESAFTPLASNPQHGVSGVTLSNGGRTFTYVNVGSSAFAACWLAFLVEQTQKRVIEWVIDGPADNNYHIGFMEQSQFGVPDTGKYPSNEGSGGFYGISNGSAFPLTDAATGIIADGVVTSNAAYEFTVGDVITAYWDPATGKVWFTKNGSAFVSENPAAGTGETLTLPDGFFDPWMRVYAVDQTKGVTVNALLAQILYPLSGFKSYFQP